MAGLEEEVDKLCSKRIGGELSTRTVRLCGNVWRVDFRLRPHTPNRRLPSTFAQNLNEYISTPNRNAAGQI